MPLTCFTWHSSTTESGVGDYWFSPSSSPFHACAVHSGLGVFRRFPLLGERSPARRSALGCTSETGSTPANSKWHVSVSAPLPRFDRVETSPHRRELPDESTPSVRFLAPLATSHVEVRCSWAFQLPASSAPGLSQSFDGLLLPHACSSCFVRAPPLGFKVQRAMPGTLCRGHPTFRRGLSEDEPLRKKDLGHAEPKLLLRTHQQHR